MMLPECRSNDYLYPTPKFNLKLEQVENFIKELEALHCDFCECFCRSETRENFFNYMVGQMSTLERKSIEPIAINVSGKESVRSMQRMVSNAEWDEEKFLSIYHKKAAIELGTADGVLTFDESGFVKKGNHSVGVARQYCGSIGKVENSQVGVFAGYASRKGYVLVDKRLFLPKQWFDADYADKRKECDVPEELEFQSKPQLAAEMLQALYKENIIPFKYIVADTIYGNSLDFIEAVEHCRGKIFFVAMPLDTLCWLKMPLTKTKSYEYKGEIHTKKILKSSEKSPISFEDFAKNLHNHFWYRRKVSEGTKGPIEYEFTKRQVVIARDGLPWKRVCLIIKRTLEVEPTYYYYVSNAPLHTRLKTFVWLSGMRWSIEQCFEETKSELGMDHYEVRKYPGWNHHILTCMLAHFFLWHLKITLEEDAPCLTLPQLRLLLKNVLPMKKFPNEEIIDLVRWIQQKNHCAYLSHRKKNLQVNGGYT